MKQLQLDMDNPAAQAEQPKAAAAQAEQPKAAAAQPLSPRPEKPGKVVAVEEPLATGAEPHVYSVSELNRAIRERLESEYGFLWLRGEISNFKPHSSGHFYFSLKDQKSQISAVMFRGFNARLKFRPEDGMEVLVRGKVTVYEPRGNYQVFCEVMEPMGAGALQVAFEQLKAKLQKEGLFEASRKRALPSLPRHLAIVTSPTGAAIRDMINVLHRRFRGLEITVVPAVVQGDKAPASIVAALRLVNQLSNVDVVIVGRGGGSIEDLWAFNDETVARAIAACRVPIISAVGHEVDFTIADFVADLRAPTPSAAAELVVKNAVDLIDRIRGLARRLEQAFLSQTKVFQKHWEQLEKRLVDPRRKLQDLVQRCDELSQRLEGVTRRWLELRLMQVSALRNQLKSPVDLLASYRQKLRLVEVHLKTGMRKRLDGSTAALQKGMSLLDSLSPLKVLKRGYAIVKKDQAIIRKSNELRTGDSVNLQFGEGGALAIIKSVKGEV